VSYLDRLKKTTEAQSCMLPKPTEAPFVSSVSKQKGAFSEITPDDALQAFIALVRATAACNHQILLHPEEIHRELDTGDVAALIQADRLDRQAWAALLAHRLTRSRIAYCCGHTHNAANSRA